MESYFSANKNSRAFSALRYMSNRRFPGSWTDPARLARAPRINASSCPALTVMKTRNSVSCDGSISNFPNLDSKSALVRVKNTLTVSAVRIMLRTRWRNPKQVEYNPPPSQLNIVGGEKDAEIDPWPHWPVGVYGDRAAAGGSGGFSIEGFLARRLGYQCDGSESGVHRL